MKLLSYFKIGRLIADLQHADDDVRHRAIDGLTNLGTDAVPHLVTALHHRSPRARSAAALVLGKIGSPEAVGPLVEALRSFHVQMRKNAAHALGRIGDVRAACPLVMTLQRDKDCAVRAEAARALGELRYHPAALPLIAKLRDEHEAVQGNAAWALGELEDIRAIPALTNMLGSDDHWLRNTAREALDKIRRAHSNCEPDHCDAPQWRADITPADLDAAPTHPSLSLAI